MKRKHLIFVSVLLASMSMMAQTPYMNENYMPTDLIGSARYVGMGGALGALGADVSAASSNPAALGLYRRSDAALSFSVLTQQEKPDLNADMTHLSFDQMGFVVCIPVMANSVRYVNFGVNYQKRANFNQSFIADNGFLNGLSQTQQMAAILNNTPYSTPLADLMCDAHFMNKEKILDDKGNEQVDKDGNPKYAYNYLISNRNNYDRTTEGGIAGYDFNISANIKDWVYLGLTIGVNNVDYYSYSTYREFLMDDQDNSDDDCYYSLYNTQNVRGYGINVKLGGIFRPIESSPFRIGLAIETPTFYHLKSYSSYSLDSPMTKDGLDFNQNSNGDIIYTPYYPDYDLADLHMRITTPWKVRVSLGHTIGTFLALGAEYEYANCAKTKQGYEDWDYDDWGYGYASGTTRDRDMDKLHKSTMRGSHSFKFGMELNLTDNVAFRAGYNYYSRMFKEEATLDQTGPSPAFGYQTTTDYMNKNDVNIFTAGLGYRGKHFYADMAYKCRVQSGDFYAFDDTYIAQPGERLAPLDVNLNTHQVFFTLGYKF